MDMRAGQGPLMPTLPHPMGLGLPPTHGHQQLGVGQAHHLGLSYQPTDLSAAGRPQSLPSSPSPNRPPGLMPPAAHISPSHNKSTFASALRDLAKNAVDPNDPTQRRVSPPSHSPMSSSANIVTSSLLDVRKGFGRTTPVESPSAPHVPQSPFSVPSSTMIASLSQSFPTTMTTFAPSRSDTILVGSGFQPYRSIDLARLQHPGLPPHPGQVGAAAAYAGYHPGMFGSPNSIQSLPSPYGPEADPLYQAQLARYAAAAASMGANSFPPLGLPSSAMSPYAGIPPSVLASYPPELLRAYALGQLPPTQVTASEFAYMHEKLRSDEVRRLELEARKEAERREQCRSRERSERSSPAPRPGSASSGKKSSSDALLRLSKIASHQPEMPMQRLQPSASQASRIEATSSKSISSIDGQQNADKVTFVSKVDLSANSNKIQPSSSSSSFNNSVKINPIPSDIKLPTKPLDFSEIKNNVKSTSSTMTCTSTTTVTSSTSPVLSISLSPSVSPSPSPPCLSPNPAYTTASRCTPYVPKPRVSPAKISDESNASTPKRLFVRPFEDDYSPIQPLSGLCSSEEPLLDISATSLSPNKDMKQITNVELDDIIKPEDQDSDYESMSSDSSIKKEGSILCPTSGHLLTDDEAGVPKEGVFREPEPDMSQKDKLKYLRYFRLVTHRKKNDIEIEKLEKRKSRLRERSPSPIPQVEERAASPVLPLPTVAPHLNRLPETHAKAMYLSAIGLCRNSEEQKSNNEIVWSAVLDDRLARDDNSAINKYFVRLRDMSEPVRGVKRCWNGNLLPPSDTDLPLSPRYLQSTPLNIPSCEALSRLSCESIHSADPISLPSSVEINLCSLQPIAKPTLLLQEVKSEPGTAPPAHLQHVGFPKVLSPFKTEIKSEPEDLSMSKKKKPNSPPPWPGVEAIIESYKKFSSDYEQEKSILIERQSRFQQEIVTRRGQVDNLSTRLSSLARLHKTLVGNHAHTQQTLEGLRSQLVAISKFSSATTK
eukprot:TRINITY_DN19571_c0_g1_i1.p1 TRINITY_DN19571_c0_g1~~TRINITY_DN19571_c0_g1_i1.p1  ORF type:complete len:998 (-),score=146.86 TRINITY_DN19571_c0_g1_i1:304-3297(-)